MRLLNHKSIQELQGNLLLAYGISGVGKTATILQTSPDPIIYLTAEGRKIKTTLAAISRPDIRMKIGQYEDFSDLIDTCMDTERFVGSKTVFLDSLTHLMIIHLAQEVLGENFLKQEDKAQGEIMKELTFQVKLSQEAYGTLSGQMNRLMRALQKLAMAGYDVVCTARTTDHPKWNRALVCAPALMGKEFSKSMDGFFDFICLLEPPDHNDDDVVPEMGSSIIDMWRYYAPLATFQPSEDFLAKWTGCQPSKGIVKRKFHIRKVFEEANAGI